MLLSSQFQRFCRDLHSEAAGHVAKTAVAAMVPILLNRLTEARKLDAGNPNRGNIGSDFGRFGFVLWDDRRLNTPANRRRRGLLDVLGEWRNAIAHQDFTKPVCRGRRAVPLAQVGQWRRTCDGLASEFDVVVARQVSKLCGGSPW